MFVCFFLCLIACVFVCLLFFFFVVFPPNVLYSQNRIFCEIIVRAYLGGISMCKLVFRLHIYWVVGCLVGCLVGCVDVCRHKCVHVCMCECVNV